MGMSSCSMSQPLCCDDLSKVDKKFGSSAGKFSGLICFHVVFSVNASSPNCLKSKILPFLLYTTTPCCLLLRSGNKLCNEDKSISIITAPKSLFSLYKPKPNEVFMPVPAAST